SLIILYTMSSVYHGLRPNMGKKVMQVLDHCTIYFLIGGTYTPIVLGPLRAMIPWLGWTIFGIVWGFCALGCTFTAIDIEKYKKLAMACYVGIGWIIVIAIKPTIQAVTFKGFLFLLLGGVAYTIGAVLYALGKKMRYMHSIFHVFVLIGTALQFIAIFAYCILR
ncbi:MAG: hemolysin III family protein, partial [Lachnospiraceae bacterium]|nr:hemolysin III family protein [Lachnospiraceae bacterium]